jgi:hypothetical protein
MFSPIGRHAYFCCFRCKTGLGKIGLINYSHIAKSATNQMNAEIYIVVYASRELIIVLYFRTVIIGVLHVGHCQTYMLCWSLENGNSIPSPQILIIMH